MARCTFLTSLLFSFGLLVLVCFPRNVMAEWSAVAESKVSYTDDVTNFSAARRLKFSEDPSQPTGIPTQLSDVIWDPSLEVIRTSSSPLGPNELSIKAAGFIFTNNPIFNHGDYRLQYKQGLSPDTSLLLRYRNVPNQFLGPNTERHTGNNLIQEERVSSHMWRTEIEHRVNESWTLMLIGRYGLRSYNDAFAERDTKLWTIGSQVGYVVNPHMALSLAYLYERGLADGRGNTQFNDDVSYKLHALSAGTDLTLIESLSLHLAYIYRRKDFTSELLGDAHLDRHDDSHQGMAEFRYRLNSATVLSASFQRTQRTSTVVTRDFNDTIYSLGGNYRF
jgi:opacity protein-like surface antigen